MTRRFQLHYGINEGVGYVVTDTEQSGQDWRGFIVYRTDSKSDGAAEADRRNAAAGQAPEQEPVDDRLQRSLARTAIADLRRGANSLEALGEATDLLIAMRNLARTLEADLEEA